MTRLEAAVKASYASSTWTNIRTQHTKYVDFTRQKGWQPFPIEEDVVIMYAIYLSFEFKSVASVSNYISGVKTCNALLGFKPMDTVFLLGQSLKGLKRLMSRPINQAPPITPAILTSIAQRVDQQSPVEVTCYTAILVAFHILLRRSNLVPESKSSFDSSKQLTRGDVVSTKGFLLVSITWTKTIQFHERTLLLPLIPQRSKWICPVAWLGLMMHMVPADKEQPLFALPHGGNVVPLTGPKLAANLTKWTAFLPECFTLHSCRRGGTTHAFHSDVPPEMIKRMGDWVSDCYSRYIDVALDDRLTAASLMADNV